VGKVLLALWIGQGEAIMSFWRLAWRNLTLRKVRTGLTIFSIAVAVAVLYTLLSFNKGYSASLKQQLQQMGVHMLVIPPGCPFEAASLLLKGGTPPQYLDEKLLAKIEEVPGIEIMAPGFMSAILRDERTDIYYGMDHRTLQIKNWWKLKPGGKWFADDQEDGVVLGSDAAVTELVIKQQTDPFVPGQELWVPELNRAMKILGILESTGTQDDGFFYVPMKTAQQIFGQPGKVTVVALRLDDPAQAGAISERLQKLEGVEVITMSELLGSQQRMMESAKMLVLSVIFIAIGISAIGVLNTVLMSVFERTREIGVMRATGASKVHIFALIWLETLLMTAMGGVIGLALAISGARLMEHAVVAALSSVKFMTVNTHSQLATYDPRIVVITLQFVLAIGLLAGVYPAFRASRQEPIEALRVE
jgi:putative ABC transport system permease protein